MQSRSPLCPGVSDVSESSAASGHTDTRVSRRRGCRANTRGELIAFLKVKATAWGLRVTREVPLGLTCARG